MKTNLKTGIISTFSLTLLLLFILPSAYAGSDSGGTFEGAYAHHRERIHQDQLDVANGLEFTAHIPPEQYSISGYNVTIDCFPTVVCTQTGPREVDVHAEGAYVYYCDNCTIDVEFWLEPSWNSVHVKNITWTYETEAKLGPPDQGWDVSCKLPYKNVTIYNDDATRCFILNDFKYLITTKYYDDLEAVPFNATMPSGFFMYPGESRRFDLYTELTKGYVYFYYKKLNCSSGDLLAEVWANHEITPICVGGVLVAVDKFGLLAPYIGLASTILVATVATAIYVKRVKHRKEKQ